MATFPNRQTAGGISVVIEGLEEVKTTLATTRKQLPRVVAGSLHYSGERIMADSKENYVPVASGVLRNSGHVALPKVTSGEIIVKLGYGGPAAPYALSVHENPRAGKTHGISPSGEPYPVTAQGKPTWATIGQWKYLEVPLKKGLPGTKKRLFSDIDRAIKKNEG